MTVAEALACHLHEKYPRLGIHTQVTVTADYVHISSERDLALLLYGSRVFRTRLAVDEVMCPLPRGYVPDIDLCEPDSLERIYRWLDCWMVTD